MVDFPTYPPTPDFDDLYNEIKDAEAVDEYANAMAVGIAADNPDPDNTGILCQVYQNKIIGLRISKGYATASEISADNAGIMIAGVILVAFDAWEKEFERLHAYASSVVAAGGAGRLYTQMENGYIPAP